MSVPPKNGQQGYGEAVARSLDDLEDVYAKAITRGKSYLPMEVANKAESAMNLLKTLFPKAPDVDAHGSGETVQRQLAHLFEHIARNDNSEMRDHLRAFVRARLYSAPNRRLKALVADPALVSIAAADPDALSLIMGINRVRLVANGPGFFVQFGQESIVPDEFMDQFVGSDVVARVSVNRHALTEAIQKLRKWTAGLVERAPWAKKVDVGGLSCTAVGLNPFPANAARFRQIADINDTIDELALINGTVSAYVGMDKTEEYCAIISKGPFAAGTQQVACGFRSRYFGAEVNLLLTVKADAVADINVTGSTNHGAIGAVFVIPANLAAGAASGLGVEFSWSRLQTRDPTIHRYAIRVSNLLTNFFKLVFTHNAAIAAGENHFLHISGASPNVYINQRELSDTERLSIIADSDVRSMMQSYFFIREELAETGVTEDWWLQAYARYFVGPNPAYTASRPLNAIQVTAIKTLMLNPDSWESIPNLDGFLEKLNDDVGSLLALAQSTDYV